MIFFRGGGVNIASYKVKPGMFPDVEDSEIFAMALKQSKKNFLAEDMVKILKEELGEDVSDFIPTSFPLDEVKMLVASNKDRVHGAAAICDKELLGRIAEKYNCNLTIFPSSIHECIICVGTDQPDKEFCNSMIQMINDTQVMPEERLSDHSYIYDKVTGEITY